MGSSLVRQWLVLTMIPTAPRRTDVRTLEDGLRARGVAVHRRTLQRDLLELATVFPLTVDDRRRPHAWRWEEPARTAEVDEDKGGAGRGQEETVRRIRAARPP